MFLIVAEVIWVIISVAEGGLLGLTQQMNSFHSLGSLNHSLTSSPSTPLVTVTSPEAATTTIAGGSVPHSFSTLFHHSEKTEDEDMSTEACASSLHNVNIDRVKSVKTDDNDENCIKICKDILTRSNSSSPDTRRSSVGKNFSPLAVSDLSSRPSIFSSPSSSHLSHQQWAGNSAHFSGHQPHSHPLPHQQPAPAASHQSANPTTFPPTPPSDDMMLENN